MQKELILQNESTKKIITFGERENFVLDTVDWGVASVTPNTIFYYPNEDSEEILNTNWNQRDVSIVGYICANSEIDLELFSRELTDFIGLQNAINIIEKQHFLTFYSKNKVRFSTDERNDNEILRRFQISGYCLDPQWKSGETIRVSSGLPNPEFNFPLYFNAGDATNPKVIFGIVSQSEVVSLDYNGVLLRGIIVRIVYNGQISNIKITSYNESTTVKQTFILNGTYNDGNITIDTRDGFMSAIENGVNDITHNVYDGSDWIKISNGLNEISVTYDSGNEADFFVEVKQTNLFEIQT